MTREQALSLTPGDKLTHVALLTPSGKPLTCEVTSQPFVHKDEFFFYTRMGGRGGTNQRLARVHSTHISNWELS